MMSEQSSPRQRRWFLAGCALTTVASVGLIVFPLFSGAMAIALSDAIVFLFVCALAILMGCGAMLAIFNLQRP